MRLSRLAIRGFRNLADGELDVPPRGFALVGRNGQGKTNLLEAAYYPVLLRSFRGAADSELVAFSGMGFHVEAEFDGETAGSLTATFLASGKKKRIAVDQVEERRLTAAIGRWLAVVFLPGDVELAGGPALERRRFLDRMLSLAEPAYLRALLRYRGALARRNAALRLQQPDVARACEPILATEGAALVERRVAWVNAAIEPFGNELSGLNESGRATPPLHRATRAGRAGRVERGIYGKPRRRPRPRHHHDRPASRRCDAGHRRAAAQGFRFDGPAPERSDRAEAAGIGHAAASGAASSRPCCSMTSSRSSTRNGSAASPRG